MARKKAEKKITKPRRKLDWSRLKKKVSEPLYTKGLFISVTEENNKKLKQYLVEKDLKMTEWLNHVIEDL